MIDTKEVIERIKQKRKDLRLTLKEVSDKMELTTAGFSKIENGDVALTLDRLQQIAHVLGVPVSELLGIDVTPQNNPSNEEIEKIRQENNELKETLKDKNNLIKRLEKDEQQYLAALDKVIESLYMVFEKWYFNISPNQSFYKMVTEEDSKFWLQFFSMRANQFAFGTKLVNDPLFVRMYEKYYKDVKENITPFQEREPCFDDAVQMLAKSVQNKDTESILFAVKALNAGLEPLGYTLKKYNAD